MEIAEKLRLSDKLLKKFKSSCLNINIQKKRQEITPKTFEKKDF